MSAAGLHPVLSATGPAELTEALVAVPSVSGAERDIADLVERRLRMFATALTVHRVGNNVIARTDSPDRSRLRLVFAGHLDTVPPSPPGAVAAPAPIPPGAVAGLGAVDMKGGIALMLLLAERAAEAAYDATFVFYDQEEVGSFRSGMRLLFDEYRELVDGDLAILLEPTGGVIEAGCQGNLVVELGFTGERAHTARPWQGVNAIHRAAPVLDRLARTTPAPVLIDGLTYRQSLSVVAFDGGVQGNVVPDRAVIRVNYRHAPTLDSDAALALVAGLAPEADSVAVKLASPPAAPALGNPLVARWRADLGLAVRPKLGWTDVGRFAAHGISAVNFGPGDPELAHTPHEVVGPDDLAHCHQALLHLLLTRPESAASSPKGDLLHATVA